MPQEEATVVPPEARLLHAAAVGDLEAVNYLVEKQADPNAAGEYHQTALMLAASNGHSQIVEFLIQSGADVNAVDAVLQTALMLAASKGHYHVVRLLIENGAEVNAVDVYQQTALMKAAAAGSLQAAQLLIANGSKVNEVDKTQQTALQIAASRGHTQVAKLLIESNANVNAVDFYQQTALMKAANQGSLRIVQFLIESGAEVNAVNKIQQTPFILAASKGILDVAVYLIESGATLAQSPVLKELFEQLRKNRKWTLKDLETEYQSINNDQVSNPEKKEQQLHILWTKVKSWIVLGANVSEIIHELSKEGISNEFPQVILKDDVLVESFLFNFFEYFRPRKGFENSALDLRYFNFNSGDVVSMFVTQFGAMNVNHIEDFLSVNEFLACNKNLICFAEFILADELLDKMAELIVSCDISNFNSFWIDFKLLFTECDEDNCWIVIPPFLSFSSRLLLAAFRKGDDTLIENIVRNLVIEDVGFDFESFWAKYGISIEKFL